VTGEFAVDKEFILIKCDWKIKNSVFSSVDPVTDTEILRRGIEFEKPEIEVRTEFTATAGSRVSPMTAFQSPLNVYEGILQRYVAYNSGLGESLTKHAYNFDLEVYIVTETRWDWNFVLWN